MFENINALAQGGNLAAASTTADKDAVKLLDKLDRQTISGAGLSAATTDAEAVQFIAPLIQVNPEAATLRKKREIEAIKDKNDSDTKTGKAAEKPNDKQGNEGEHADNGRNYFAAVDTGV